VTSIYQSVGTRHKIVLIFWLKVRLGKEKHPLKFPKATANFSTSFHTATTVAEWHKIGIGDWVQKRKLSSIDYLTFSVLQFVPEFCAEIQKVTLQTFNYLCRSTYFVRLLPHITRIFLLTSPVIQRVHLHHWRLAQEFVAPDPKQPNNLFRTKKVR